jgi:hypothetical protein
VSHHNGRVLLAGIKAGRQVKVGRHGDALAIQILELDVLHGDAPFCVHKVAGWVS